MLDYSKLINGSNAFSLISKDIASARLSHAYLFLSSDSNYLVKFAENVCSLLIDRESPELSSQNKLRIQKRVHPDIRFFGETENIDSATVTEIVEAAQIAPFEANIKIFVLCGTEKMNESSQNKILKTIEEPPTNTFFLLLNSAKSRLLPTILSRVKQVELDSPSVSEIAEMLTGVGIDDRLANIYASCVDGNASFAEKLATDNSFLTLFDKTINAFYNINGSRDVLEYSSYFSNKNVDKNEFVQIALMICRDLQMVLLNKLELVSLKSEINKLKLISASLTLDGANKLAKECLSAKQKLFFNVNPTAVADELLFKIAEVKVRCKKL